MARLKEQYKAEVAPALMKQFGYKSVMQIPKIDKVVINGGCGEARENAKVLDNVVDDRTQRNLAQEERISDLGRWLRASI